MSSGEKSLWDIALEEKKKKKAASVDKGISTSETTVLLVGSKGSGKTALIQKFLEKDEPLKATVALDYQYARKPSATGTNKDIAHIYELGGGLWLKDLIDIVFDMDSIESSVLILCLDLSEPTRLWTSMEALLGRAHERIFTLLEQLDQLRPALRARLHLAASQRLEPKHPDRELVDPFLVPLAIVGTKYDLFQSFEPEQRKFLCRSLRFLAHYYAAPLIFVSNKLEPLTSKWRGLLGHLAFGGAGGPGGWNLVPQMDHSKPLLVPIGADSLQQIGLPPGNPTNAKTPLDLWKNAFLKAYPQEAEKSMAEEDPGRDPQFAEAVVDAARAARDDELERVRRASERKLRELQQQALAEGVPIL